MSENKIYTGGEFLIADCNPADVFIPENMTEEHKMIFDTANEFVKKEIISNSERIEEKDDALIRELMEKAGELGLVGTDVPEEYGGLGLDKVSSTLVMEAFGQGGSFIAVFGSHTGIGFLPLVYFGSDEQKSKYLPKLASGEWIGASALTESGAGSDAMNAKTKAVLSEDGKHYILNGEKIFITNAGYADSFIVYAKIDGKDFTGFFLEKDYPGLSTGKEEKKMGSHGSSTRNLIMEDALVPVENVIYNIGKGAKIAFNILNLGRWKLAAGTVGGCKECLKGSVEYANMRVQFGHPISSFGMIKTKLATMAIKTFINDSIVYRLAGMFDDKLDTLDEAAKKDGTENAKAIEEYATECSISKIYGSECLDYCVDEYVQILGGYGYCSEYPAERFYRDSRINRIWEGTNEINRMLIIGTLMKRAMQGRLDLLAAAKNVTSDLMSYSPMSVELPDTPLALQEHMVKMSKKIVLMVAGVAAQKFMMELQNEQEVLALLGDIVIEVFAMESGLLRAERVIADQGEDKASYHIAAVQVYVDEQIPKIEAWAKQVIAFVEDGDMQRTQIMGVRKLARYQQIDTITLTRKIADRVIKLEKYPF